MPLKREEANDQSAKKAKPTKEKKKIKKPVKAATPKKISKKPPPLPKTKDTANTSSLSQDGKDDILNTDGIYTVLIKSIPDNRIIPNNCKNHRITIEHRLMILSCETILGGKREWVYSLEEPFRDGKLIIRLKENVFNAVMLQLKVCLFSLQDKSTIMVNRRYRHKIIDYTLDRGF